MTPKGLPWVFYEINGERVQATVFRRGGGQSPEEKAGVPTPPVGDKRH